MKTQILNQIIADSKQTSIEIIDELYQAPQNFVNSCFEKSYDEMDIEEAEKAIDAIEAHLNTVLNSEQNKNRDLRIWIERRLSEGYTHVYYPSDAGADLEKQITDKTYCRKSREACIAEIENERRKPYEHIRFTCWIWDLKEELETLNY